MRGEGSEGNREVPRVGRPLEEGGPWGKHGFPHGSEPEASDAHFTATTIAAVTSAFSVAAGSRIFQPKRISWS